MLEFAELIQFLFHSLWLILVMVYVFHMKLDVFRKGYTRLVSVYNYLDVRCRDWNYGTSKGRHTISNKSLYSVDYATPFTVKQSGRDAFKLGISRNDCPIDRRTHAKAIHYWLEGWDTEQHELHKSRGLS